MSGGPTAVWTPDARLTLPAPRRLRLLSFNIHVGLRVRGYAHYLTRAWRHALPGAGMFATLDAMAELMRGYDFVALQEADAGSLRTRFVDQVRYLAKRAGFPYHGLAVTRDLRPVAQHCLGYLSRIEPLQRSEHVLPSRIPGRRALRLELGAESGGMVIVLAHLSLGRADRRRQLDFVSGLVPRDGPAVVLGDLNCGPADLAAHAELRRIGLWLPEQPPATFPSWRPQHSIDHILLNPAVQLHRVEALPHAISDHLPLAAEISVRLPS